MKEKPVLGQCKLSGEVSGLENVYLVDGSSLPNLTEKSHTLTIMANADRIAREYLKIV
ncbi:GMC oxidoreductase [Vibrio mimicus]|nr:GMC oxidoreductase [Vibrio mimicus]